MEKIVVIVEDVEIAKTALHWALHNILRGGDLVILLHVFSCYTNTKISNNKKKNLRRRLRLKGFQLALSFRDFCTDAGFTNTKTEIVVMEGEGGSIAAVVREIGASTLVLGLHDQSFIYKLAMPEENMTRNLNCKVLAIKEPTTLTSRTISIPLGSSTNMDFSQIEIATLRIPEVPSQKVPYQICPDPSAIIWRSRPSRTRRTTSN
ncbi:hypothetical protein ACJIZ3_009844 [Penstemon smallii]|uniref:UspA domain-containing protein n=1 Tax=Penstemon smallii TaxID=265156 RepID=A0ABD3TFG3_9LAMI